MTPEEKQKIATFRFVVIGDLVASNLEPGEQERLIGEKIRRKWQIPLSLRTRVGRSTILRWIKLYKDSGNKIESLFPDERNDRGKTRAIDNETALIYGKIKADLRRKGTPIPENDIWIAASAIQHRLKLSTRDKHFLEIAGLKTLAW